MTTKHPSPARVWAWAAYAVQAQMAAMAAWGYLPGPREVRRAALRLFLRLSAGAGCVLLLHHLLPLRAPVPQGWRFGALLLLLAAILLLGGVLVWLLQIDALARRCWAAVRWWRAVPDYRLVLQLMTESSERRLAIASSADLPTRAQCAIALVPHRAAALALVASQRLALDVAALIVATQLYLNHDDAAALEIFASAAFTADALGPMALAICAARPLEDIADAAAARLRTTPLERLTQIGLAAGRGRRSPTAEARARAVSQGLLERARDGVLRPADLIPFLDGQMPFVVRDAAFTATALMAPDAAA